MELPIIVREGDDIPIKTIPEIFREVSKKIGDKNALVIKKYLDSDKKKFRILKWTWK